VQESVRMFDGINDNSPEVIDAEVKIYLETIDKLLKLGYEILTQDLTHDAKDDFAFMAVAFCRRQMEHLKSLVTLYHNQCYLDLRLVARAIIEGFAYLYWGKEHKEVVPRRWRSYSAVIDYRLAMKNMSSGKTVPDEIKNDIVDKLTKYGSQFLRKKQSLRIDFKSDPFQNYWHLDNNGEKVNTYELFKLMNAQPLCVAYEDMSDWIHWNAKGFALILARDENWFGFNYDDKKLVSLAFTSSLLGFTESFLCLIDHFHLEIKKHFLEVRNQSVNAIGRLHGKEDIHC
jgi:Family of unknown function (DUF5677)